MTKVNVMTTEIICNYVEVPKAIWELQRMGYSLEEIHTRRVTACSYVIMGRKVNL